MLVSPRSGLPLSLETLDPKGKELAYELAALKTPIQGDDAGVLVGPGTRPSMSRARGHDREY